MAKKQKLSPIVSAYMAQISGRGKGGKARAKNLSPERLSEIAKKAAAARWGKRVTALKDSQDSPYPFPPPQVLLPNLLERKAGRVRAKKAAGASAKVRKAKAKARAAK